jgi:outer membrane protein TolC
MGDNPSTRFLSIPASLTLEQPLFGLNRIKWLRRIEPVRFREAELQIVSDFEEVALTVIDSYFNLLLAQTAVESAAQNVANSERLYAIAEARRTIGQLAETELMQLRVALLNARSALTEAQTNHQYQMFQLRSCLGFGEGEVVEPVVPEFDPAAMTSLDYDEVLSLARQNNPFTQSVQRRLLEAQRAVSQAKADRFDITLFASVGMSGQEDRFHQVFQSRNWRDNQQIEVGLRIPILDWGKGKGRVMTARANHEVVRSQIEKEEMDFDQHIFIRVLNFNNQPSQLLLARETDQIARQRYQTTVEAFVAGMVDILNLNDSQSSKDAARGNYIRQLAALWSYHYQIRSLTLHDFVTGRALTIPENLLP